MSFYITILSAFYDLHIFHSFNEPTFWTVRLRFAVWEPTATRSACKENTFQLPSALYLLFPSWVNLWRLSAARCPQSPWYWSNQPIASTSDDSREITAQNDLRGEVGWSHISARHFIVPPVTIRGLIISEIGTFVPVLITQTSPHLCASLNFCSVCVC